MVQVVGWVSFLDLEVAIALVGMYIHHNGTSVVQRLHLGLALANARLGTYVRVRLRRLKVSLQRLIDGA